MTPSKEIAALKRKIAALERDRMFARSLLLPGQMAVYRAAMRWNKWLSIGKPGADYRKYCDAFEALNRACARSRRGIAKKGKK